DKGNSDINLFEMHGSGEIPLVKHPAKDMPLGWVPGRKEFLFTSDRSGTWDLWAIPVDKGKPSGPVERIYTNVGQVQPVGFAQNGDCFIGFSRRNFSAIIAPFNAETGELDEKSGKSLLGSNWLATWSPDGRYLAYGGDDRQVHIRDLKTGEERVLTEILINAVYPCWSPDGNSILMVGIDKDKFRTQGYKGGVYAVDVKTSRITEILLLSDYQYNTPDDDAFPLSDVQWSLDGKSIFYLFFKDRLVKHDLATGEDTILYKHPNFERDVMKRSPDGKKLFFATRPPEGKKSRLFTIPVEGGKEKELCTAQEADIFGIGMWSPDGIYIYFTEVKDGGTSLWRIPAEGGTPQKVWQSKNRAVILGIHPDGTQMAFTINERELEIRVIENLVEELDKVFKASK
ncbi:MAG: hypothetical protein MUQ25_04625, partial [Candidatus Aminicenantes bacterium]|nr:hypothetical protein [Candidatus Aminicenantes bacterium]